MVTKFLDQKLTTTATATRTAKKQQVYINNTTTLHVRHASVHFFAVVARLRQSHETSIFHAPVLWSRWPQHKKRSFSKHRYGPFGFNLRKVRQYLIKNWNWVTSVKFETVRLSVCCHPEKLLPCQRDVTTSPFFWGACYRCWRETHLSCMSLDCS